jgi:hypothetical protein
MLLQTTATATATNHTSKQERQPTANTVQNVLQTTNGSGAVLRWMRYVLADCCCFRIE